MQSPQIAARSPTSSPSPTRGEGSQISFWCEIPPLPWWERGQGVRGFTDFASALYQGVPDTGLKLCLCYNAPAVVIHEVYPLCIALFVHGQ